MAWSFLICYDCFMETYLALLRGVNVGGNSLIKMANLRDTLTKEGFSDVRTYIQSGNVIFKSGTTNTAELAEQIKSYINKDFGMSVDVVVFSKTEWQLIISSAPKWWGDDKTWKHNLLILIRSSDMSEAIEALGNLKPEIESVEPGKGVLYQSMSFEKFGRTSSSKLVLLPVYKKMTIRNFNTATKLLALFD